MSFGVTWFAGMKLWDKHLKKISLCLLSLKGISQSYLICLHSSLSSVFALPIMLKRETSSAAVAFEAVARLRIFKHVENLLKRRKLHPCTGRFNIFHPRLQTLPSFVWKFTCEWRCVCRWRQQQRYFWKGFSSICSLLSWLCSRIDIKLPGIKSACRAHAQKLFRSCLNKKLCPVVVPFCSRTFKLLKLQTETILL